MHIESIVEFDVVVGCKNLTASNSTAATNITVLYTLNLMKGRSEWRDCTARYASTARGRTKV